MFGDLTPLSFENLHICNINILQCKSYSLNIDMFKYYRFGNTNACFVFFARLVST